MIRKGEELRVGKGMVKGRKRGWVKCGGEKGMGKVWWGKGDG